MTISYNWLCEYLPVRPVGLSIAENAKKNQLPVLEPERLSKILTAIGLEVESLEVYEEVPGGLQGLVIGEVMECTKHPNADKLSLTRVSVGGPDLLQIVCGAPNVAVGQKVVVAPVGTTIHPLHGEPMTMKLAKIRSVESQGMICAEDEIGLGESHAGILVLPAELKPGTPAAEYFKPHTDWVYEIGLTPNRMDAMSHLGVARDVCAYLNHHDKIPARVISPFSNAFKASALQQPIKVLIENSNACQRYSGISLHGVQIAESPLWLRQHLKSIGLRPINNIVDITNFVLHETGQPLHAFDQDALNSDTIKIMNLPAGTPFITLDDKKRSLHAEDLMICNGANEPLCMAGIFGGKSSGVTASTRTIFLESAWFNPVDIRKSSFRHELRTDAATRFEKNTDISNTVQVLKRAAQLIVDIAGGEIASDIVDIYPEPKPKTQTTLRFHYLKKLSGKNYHSDAVKRILGSLGFEIMREGLDDILVAVPYSKPDVSLPADIVEEIMRIDGLDNIEIPSSITISPSVERFGYKQVWKEKTANYLAAQGFHEIFTNSITNAAYFDEADLDNAVRLLNNLSAEHNIMRPSMLETGLEAVAYNLNRKNHQIRFFEFGKTYQTSGPGQYQETDHLSIYISGPLQEAGWKTKATDSDLYYAKGVAASLLKLMGIGGLAFTPIQHPKWLEALQLTVGKESIGELGTIHPNEQKRFDIKQAVYSIDLEWEKLLDLARRKELTASEIPRQLPVYRDLALVVPAGLPYAEVEKTVKTVRVDKLKEMKLFDIFESEKLGKDKKSLAISFTFLDAEKTLTDKEIDSMMGAIRNALEKQLQAEIRK